MAAKLWRISFVETVFEDRAIIVTWEDGSTKMVTLIKEINNLPWFHDLNIREIFEAVEVTRRGDGIWWPPNSMTRLHADMLARR